jgi:prophage DNA circulation protein
MSDESTIFETLQPGSFDGIVMPVVEVKFANGQAVVRHRFPYRNGQVLEYMGGDPLTGSIRAAYFNGIEEGGTADMWPGAVTLMRRRCSLPKSGPLVIPTYGTINANLRISETYSPDTVDGLYVDFTFEEDSLDLAASTLTSRSSYTKMENVAAECDNLQAAVKLVMADRLMDAQGNKLTNFRDSVTSLQSQIDDIQSSLSAPIESANAIVETCESLLRTVSSLGDVANWPVADALRNLIDSVRRAVEDVIASKNLVTYTTAGVTTVNDVANNTSNTVEEVLALNIFDDPFSIPADLNLLVYAR